MNLAYILAWLLPLSTGIVVYMAASPQRVRGWKSTCAGYGFLFGMLLVAAFASIAARDAVAQAWMNASWCLLPVFVIAAAIAWRRRAGASSPSESSRVLSNWQCAGLAAMLASLAVRGAIIAREVWLRPLYPWDAWSAWAVKPKTWFLLDHYVPFVSMPDWLSSAQGDLYTEVAWHYPNALAWIELWFASAAGGWIEPLINLPWLGLWIALLLGHYGQWRALGMDRVRALIFVYALGSLPLLSVHVALAGYADLWVATGFGFGVLAWMRWLQRRERSQLWLALLCALILPWLKMEGWIWAACLLGAIGFGALPSRWRWSVAIGGAVLFVVLFPLGGLRFLCIHAGVMNVDGSIAVPAIGPLALVLNLHWRSGAAGGAVETLFAQPNWHLLWWLTPAILVWRWRELIVHDWLRLPALLLLVCATLLLILFLFTGASAWAQSYTAINRLVLQIVPAWVTVLAMLLRDARWPEPASGTVPARAPHSDPA
ncbi:MAG: hypothetical protein J0I77_21460 [Rudaea sp.]|nr:MULTISPECIES: hypothetical protein [unclassified Rudaea]MBN8888295.1 hypothetical protein [Rudaea sp.]